MSFNFTKIHAWHVRSDEGYTVEIGPYGVIYIQNNIRVEIPHEWLMDNGIGLSLSSGACKGLGGLHSDLVHDILTRIKIALKYIGFNAEFFGEMGISLEV